MTLFSVRRATLVFSATLLLGLLWAASSLAESRTTSPTSRVQIYVLIHDKKIDFAIYRSVNTEDPGTKETILEQNVVRGDTATFIVENRGAKPHNFAILGHTISTLKPGGKAQFTTPLVRRGSFQYTSTVGTHFKGTFIVY